MLLLNNTLSRGLFDDVQIIGLTSEVGTKDFHQLVDGLGLRLRLAQDLNPHSLLKRALLGKKCCSIRIWSRRLRCKSPSVWRLNRWTLGSRRRGRLTR